MQRIGVEIEFAGVTAEMAASIVAENVNGEMTALGAHHFKVEADDWGKFTIKLDTRFAEHDKTDLPGHPSHETVDSILDLTTPIIPIEIVTPPIPADSLGRLDQLLNILKQAGARGTDDSLAWAFGVHFNPELQDIDETKIRTVLQAFSLGQAWIYDAVGIDLTRRLLAFAKPYPEPYVRIVTASNYSPQTPQLIDEYLVHNASRDRALDMLPLFAHLDRNKIVAALPNEPVSARPTLHYRLANSKIDAPDWTLQLEWQRWQRLASLADDHGRLGEALAAFRNQRHASMSKQWREASRPFIEI